MAVNFNVPDYPEPFTGYRTWSMSYDHPGVLKSVFTDLEWPKGVLEAKCFPRNPYSGFLPRLVKSQALEPCDRSPSKGCKSLHPCGIYSYSTFKNLEVHALAGVWGEVLIGGEVWQHENGYRASHARVSAIYDTTEINEFSLPLDALALAAEYYNVPLVRMEA